MLGIEYGITYHYANGAYRAELGFMDQGDDVPDIAKVPIDKGVWCIQIGYTQPIEHELVLRKGVTINPKEERWPFTAMYWPGATPLPYQTCMSFLSFNPTYKHGFEKHIAELIQYGVNYAGYDTDERGRAKITPQELIYLQTATGDMAALSENSALLIPEGHSWRKKSPFNFRYGI